MPALRERTELVPPSRHRRHSHSSTMANSCLNVRRSSPAVRVVYRRYKAHSTLDREPKVLGEGKRCSPAASCPSRTRNARGRSCKEEGYSAATWGASTATPSGNRRRRNVAASAPKTSVATRQHRYKNKISITCEPDSQGHRR